MISIDFDKCDNCNLCFQACFVEAIGKGPEIARDAEANCIECGHCYSVCPRGAITVLGYEDAAPRTLPEERPVSGPAMMDFLRCRRSCRGFRKGVEVPEENLRAIIAAASTAPSAHNARPLKAYVYRDAETIERIRRCNVTFYRRLAGIFRRPAFKLSSKMMGMSEDQRRTLLHTFDLTARDHGGKDVVFYDAPSLLVFTAPRLDSMGLGDAWLAAGNALLYADAIGVATCFSGLLIMAANWDPRLRRIMGIPWRERVVGALMVGYARREWKREAPRKQLSTEWR